MKTNSESSEEEENFQSLKFKVQKLPNFEVPIKQCDHQTAINGYSIGQMSLVVWIVYYIQYTILYTLMYTIVYANIYMMDDRSVGKRFDVRRPGQFYQDRPARR